MDSPPVNLDLILKVKDNDGNVSLDSTLVTIIGQMKDIKGGCFSMGMHRGHTCVDDFIIGVTEVTQAEYLKVMGHNPSRIKNCLNFPVDNVSGVDAILYANAFSKLNKFYTVYIHGILKKSEWSDYLIFDSLKIDSSKNGYRLPYESEWEYAIKAGTTTKYYWGGSFDEKYSWNCDNSNSTQPVGTRIPNGWGLYDMNGNVWEWVNGKFMFPPNSSTMIRGGSFSACIGHHTSESNVRQDLERRFYTFGFRIARNNL